MFNVVDTAFIVRKSIDRLLISLVIFQGKESNWHEISNADTTFLLSGAESLYVSCTLLVHL